MSLQCWNCHLPDDITGVSSQKKGPKLYGFCFRDVQAPNAKPLVRYGRRAGRRPARSVMAVRQQLSCS